MCFLVKCLLIFAKNGFRRSQHIFTYIGQRDTTKMTVWYVRRDYVFRVNYHFVGETLPNQSQRWIFHFPSYLVIELFHMRCLNDYFLLVFHFSGSSYFLIYPKCLQIRPKSVQTSSKLCGKIPFLYNKKIFFWYKKKIFFLYKKRIFL